MSGRRAPGPPGHPLLGQLREFRRDALGALLSAAAAGDIVRLRLGPHVLHLVNDPGLAAQVLRDPGRYDRRTRSAAKVRAICRDSLLTTDGEAWRVRRERVQPAFQHGLLAAQVPAMAARVQEALDAWPAKAGAPGEVDVAREMSRLTCGIAGSILLGAEVDPETGAIARALDIVLDHTFARLQRLVDWPPVLPVGRDRRFRAARGALRRIVGGVLERRTAGRGGVNALDRLCEPDRGGRRLGPEAVQDEALTLLLAGYETTANALAWTFHLLGREPGVEARVREEVSRVLGGRTPAPADLADLRYTTMVLREAVRLYPPIWIVERRAVHESSLEGFAIPRGSSVIVSPFTLHRHPRYWRDPERFDPGRFAPEAGGGREPDAYLPFGTGPRACVGQGLATIEARVILAMVLQRFRLRPIDDRPVVPWPGITLRPRDGLPMRVERA